MASRHFGLYFDSFFFVSLSLVSFVTKREGKDFSSNFYRDIDQCKNGFIIASQLLSKASNFFLRTRFFFFFPILKRWPIIGRGKNSNDFESSFEGRTKGKIDELFNLISPARSEFRTTLTRKRYLPPFLYLSPLSSRQLCATFLPAKRSGQSLYSRANSLQPFLLLKESSLSKF